MIAKRSPPRPRATGPPTLSTAAVVTAASIAFPPRLRTSSPACTASGWLLATIPLRAITSERCCGNHPLARSPDTALHHDAFGVGVHDWIGDCAAGINGDSMTARNNARLSTARRDMWRSFCGSVPGQDLFLL